MIISCVNHLGLVAPHDTWTQRGHCSACQEPSPISAPRYGQRPTVTKPPNHHWYPNHQTLNQWIMSRKSNKKLILKINNKFTKYGCVLFFSPLLSSRNRNCLPNIWMCPLVIGLKLPHESNITWVLVVSVILIVVNFGSIHMRALFAGLLFACSRKRRGLVQLRQSCFTPPDAELDSDRLSALMS